MPTVRLSLSLSLSVAPNLEHRASVKFFVSLQFLNLRQSADSLDGGSVHRKRATYTEHKHRINADTHALSGIRAHDPSVRADEGSSSLKPRGHCDRPLPAWESQNINNVLRNVNSRARFKCVRVPQNDHFQWKVTVNVSSNTKLSLA
jgi:hypothetical protein